MHGSYHIQFSLRNVTEWRVLVSRKVHYQLNTNNSEFKVPFTINCQPITELTQESCEKYPLSATALISDEFIIVRTTSIIFTSAERIFSGRNESFCLCKFIKFRSESYSMERWKLLQFCAKGIYNPFK